MSSPEAELAAVVRAQHGAFTWEQARAAGFTGDQVRRWLAAGRWHRAMRGVFVDAASPATWERTTTVALLSRPDGAAALLTSARIHRLVDSAPQPPTLLVPRGSSGRSPVARIIQRHHVPEDLTVVHGFRTTSVARTLVDLAPSLGPKRVRDLVDRAMHQRATTPAAVDRAIDRAVKLSARSRDHLHRALEVWRAAVRPGSAAEARLLRLLAEWGFEAPERQVVVVDREGTIVARIDVGWPTRRLGLEYDSIEWHGPARWASDEERHRLLASLGWDVLHVEAPDLRPGSDLRRRLDDAWQRTDPEPGR